MRLLFVVALMLISQNIAAIDLGGIDIGDTCSKVEEVAAARSLRPKYDPTLMRSVGAYYYDGTWADGTTISMGYRCDMPQGRVIRSTLDVPTADRASADAIYADMRARMIDRVGAPQFDSDLLTGTAAQRYGDIAARGWIIRNTTWTNVVHQEVQVILEHDNVSGGWRVSTSVLAK